MKVVILAGGRGSRLHEETKDIQSQWLKLKNQFWHIMKNLLKLWNKGFIISKVIVILKKINRYK